MLASRKAAYLSRVSIAFFLVEKSSLHAETEEGGLEFVGPWISYVPRGVKHG